VLYLLDANILITAANTYYGFKRVPEFWGWLEHQATSGCVKMPLEMYEEILEGRKENDELLDWAKEDKVRAALVFNETSKPELVQHVVAEGYAKDLKDDEVERIGRDPFLIAYAFGNGERCKFCPGHAGELRFAPPSSSWSPSQGFASCYGESSQFDLCSRAD
jgi:Domain of unknown function (DUF4411)